MKQLLEAAEQIGERITDPLAQTQYDEGMTLLRFAVRGPLPPDPFSAQRAVEKIQFAHSLQTHPIPPLASSR